MEFDHIIMRLQNGSDVRGAAIAANGEEKTLTPGIVTIIASAFAAWLSDRLSKPQSDLRIGLGHDSRITSSALKSACIAGLPSQIYDCGLISTPAMFQSTVLPESHFDAAIMITASHLPFNRNGLKFFTSDGALNKSDLTDILKRAAAIANQYGRADEDNIICMDIKERRHAQPFALKQLYCDHLKQIICKEIGTDASDMPLKGIRIAVDAGNGAAGFFATDILAPLGADISGSVYLEPDGTFPFHNPNPENAEAMASARRAVLTSHADLGVIFDCDGDRGAVVLSDGTEVNRNTLIAMLSAIIAPKHPHAAIVTDSITSDELHVFLEEKLHLHHLRYRRGYKNVIDKGIELNGSGIFCPLAIETSGHGAFKDNYFSDDGAYIAVIIICELAKLRRRGISLDTLIADLAQPAEARELRFFIHTEQFADYGRSVLSDFKAFAAQDSRFCIADPNYEGIRIQCADEEVTGWMLLRMSLHDPVMPMNIESQNPGGVDILLKRVQPFFDKYPELSLH